ncbi:hypothetical protein ABT116_23540 [Streptomyces sp. NPDC002130]|uniref:hypothetical protein n=1 Tax=Streptomyces sp. NPDC002130 TaxID=3155568 RepID=UPI00332A8B3D
MAFSVLELFGVDADHDAAAPGVGQGPGGVGVENDCVLGGGGCVGADHAARLAFEVLADKSVVAEDTHRNLLATDEDYCIAWRGDAPYRREAPSLS